MPKSINYGLAVFKTILAFYVIKSHCLRISSKKNTILYFILEKRRSIHVPSFFIMSFYFNYKGLISLDSNRISKRFIRLLIPYIFWPVIIYIWNNILWKYFRKSLEYSIRKLIYQLVFGRGIISPLWFQLYLILTTFLFIIIIYIFKKNYLFFLQLLMIVAYLFQYSKYNFSIYTFSFEECFEREIRMIPFAVTGFTLSSLNIISVIKKYQFQTFRLALLKSILAFYVIRSHCLQRSSKKNVFSYHILEKRRSIHVPSFFVMSFYFNYKGLISRDSKRNFRRFERLLIPYIFWPSFYFIILNIFGSHLQIQKQFILQKLIYQLVFGRGILNPLWFQLDLMLTTFFFLVIIYIFKKYYLFILHLLMIIAYFLQYSKYNYYFFAKSIVECRYSIGREIMIIPFSITGFTLAALNIIYFIKKNQFKSFFFSIIIFVSIDNLNIITNLGDYNGIKLNILSICLVFFFSLIPFEKIKQKYIIIFIDYFSRYTAGIFYLHIIIYYCLKNYISLINKGTVRGLFIIYIICYIICHFGMVIFGKTKAKNLFS